MGTEHDDLCEVVWVFCSLFNYKKIRNLKKIDKKKLKNIFTGILVILGGVWTIITQKC